MSSPASGAQREELFDRLVGQRIELYAYNPSSPDYRLGRSNNIIVAGAVEGFVLPNVRSALCRLTDEQSKRHADGFDAAFAAALAVWAFGRAGAAPVSPGENISESPPAPAADECRQWG